MSDPQRAPDELDALLQRTEENTEKNDGAAARGAPDGGQHRKSHSVHTYSPASNSHNHSLLQYGKSRRPSRHRKHMSSISEFLHGIDLEPIREDFIETTEAVRKKFVQGLDSMDRGETSFYDMSMTRSLSILPDDICELVDEVGVAEPVKEATGPPFFQYFALFSAVVAVSSNSTALKMLDGVQPPMKLYWRMTASYLALAPFAIRYLYKDGIPHLSLFGWLTFFSAVLMYSMHGCLFVTALEYTTIGNAVIYANSQALLLIVGKACVGERIHPLEACGVVTAFTGAILCSKDSEGSSRAENASNALFGDFLALMSAVTGVTYLTFAKAVRSQTSVSVFIFSVMFFGSFLILLFIAMNNDLHLEFTMDPYDGVFGWLNIDKHRLPILIYLAVVCNGLGTAGFVRAMEYFDNVVIAVATLMEPLMASYIAFAFHAGLLPGPLGWFGNFLVVSGTLAVVYPSMGKENTLH